MTSCRILKVRCIQSHTQVCLGGTKTDESTIPVPNKTNRETGKPTNHAVDACERTHKSHPQAHCAHSALHTCYQTPKANVPDTRTHTHRLVSSAHKTPDLMNPITSDTHAHLHSTSAHQRKANNKPSNASTSLPCNTPHHIGGCAAPAATPLRGGGVAAAGGASCGGVGLLLVLATG